jgi:hypothetical protein
MADVIENPDVTKACACNACELTAMPSCATSALAASIDAPPWSTDPSCASALGTPLMDTAGTCQPIAAIDHGVANYKFVAQPPIGGTCKAKGAAHPENVAFTAQGRVCASADANAARCAGGCASQWGALYHACITAPGLVACPAGPLSVKHVVSTGVSLSCSDCACTVAAQCAGRIDLYTSSTCDGIPAHVPADGVCRPSTVTGSGLWYRYAAPSVQAVACNISGVSTPSPDALQNLATVCCAP